MKQSELFTKVLREAPKDEVSVNAQLLIRGGFIHKVMAGAYEYLPLGLRVLNNINQIIREEMNAIGGVELSMTALQDKQTWEKTNRWSDETVDVWFKSKLKSNADVGLGFTHEEPLTSLMKNYISSYRDLPVLVYQIQTKFRNELRAKSGIMRGREFLMKDLYSFCRSKEQHEEFYGKAKNAYLRIFERVGLGDRTFVTFASGGSFSKYSHEFQTLTEAGEDMIYLDRKKKIAVNKEVLSEEVISDLGLSKGDLEEVKAVEVGNIFSLGTRFSDAFNLNYIDEKGQSCPVIMGSYGIGPGRVMGTVVEIFHDDKGIIWPEAIAPYKYHLINIAKDPQSSESIYQTLLDKNYSVLYDQRDETAGVKFADSDLIGLPLRILVSDKTLKEDSVELKNRQTQETQLIKIKDLSKHLKK
ncbi:MAG TPA: aminoacyl--tRNA ligase-related protein [Verrucomicrobiae bacterium]|nr:aminoacyl--tRNA ligase-related protein [Verrucomicrobiae bacterium]